VSVLFVEGDLDEQILVAVFGGGPTIKRGGTKHDLPKHVLEEQTVDRRALFIRDRDFDFDPPADRTRPHEVPKVNDRQGKTLGYYWCRHEMENYLLEPAIVIRALRCEESAYLAALLEAASRIRDYEAARGAIGVARRSLPPNFKFETRPDEVPGDKLKLPANLSDSGVRAWVKAHAAAFSSRVSGVLEPTAMERLFEERRALLDPMLATVAEILVHFSGKDLLAALAPWIAGQPRLATPGDLRARLRDWMREHPEDTLMLLPEWAAFLDILKR
jgi:hypothetical protein